MGTPMVKVSLYRGAGGNLKLLTKQYQTSMSKVISQLINEKADSLFGGNNTVIESVALPVESPPPEPEVIQKPLSKFNRPNNSRPPEI